MSPYLRARLMVSLLVVVVLASLYSVFSMPTRMKNASEPKVREASKKPDSPKEPLVPLADGTPPTPLSQLKGKIVVFDFWATWCGPCKISMPELDEVYKKYKDKGVIVVGVSVDKPEDVKRYEIIRKSVSYPTAMASDVKGLADMFEISSLPSMYVFDQNGKKRKSISGYRPGWLEEVIEDLLKQKPAP